MYGQPGAIIGTYSVPETACARESEMATAVNRLTGQVQQSQDCLERLRQQLEAVVRPSVPQIKNENQKQQQIGAPLAQWMDEKANALASINAGLCDLLDRLEL